MSRPPKFLPAASVAKAKEAASHDDVDDEDDFDAIARINALFDADLGGKVGKVVSNQSKYQRHLALRKRPKYQWHIALLDAHRGIINKNNLRSAGPPRLVRDADAAEQATFYETMLLSLPWLAPKVRVAIMQELGLSQRQQNVLDEAVLTELLRSTVEWYKKELRQRNKRPRGGIHKAAMEFAASVGEMTPGALKERFSERRRKRVAKFLGLL
jgi:hypothetical protein